MSMEDTDSQLQSEAAAIAALTQLQGGGAGVSPSGESLEDQQLRQALALSMQTASQDAQTRSKWLSFTPSYSVPCLRTWPNTPRPLSFISERNHNWGHSLKYCLFFTSVVTAT